VGYDRTARRNCNSAKQQGKKKKIRGWGVGCDTLVVGDQKRGGEFGVQKRIKGDEEIMLCGSLGIKRGGGGGCEGEGMG